MLLTRERVSNAETALARIRFHDFANLASAGGRIMDLKIWAAIVAIGNLLAFASWVLLIGFPEAKVTRFCVRSLGVSLLLCFLYLAPAITLAKLQTYVQFTSLAGLREFFGQPAGIAAGWCHYLAIDLAVGVWMVDDADHRGVGGIARAPILLLTYLAAPAGVLVYFVARRITK